MAIRCVICGKKQSGFIEDFPLSNENEGLRICAKCQENKVILANTKIPEEKNDAVEYFKTSLKENTMDEVNECVKQFILEAEERIEKLEREKSEEQLEKERIIAEEKEAERIVQERKVNLMLTTGTSFEGYKVVNYIDVLCEELVFKNSLWKSLAAGIEDLGNSLSFRDREMSGATELIANARKYVMEKFKVSAARKGANAILGIEFESSFGSDVVRVSVSGTAVEIQKVEV